MELNLQVMRYVEALMFRMLQFIRMLTTCRALTACCRQTPRHAQRALVKSLRKTLLTALDLNANYLEGKANGAAIAAGDIEIGINVITRIGFQVAGKGVAHRIAGIVDAGAGWVHVREAKSVKGNEGHVWEGGIASTKGVPPTTYNTGSTWNVILFLLIFPAALL